MFRRKERYIEMKVIKRSGEEVEFSIRKVIDAITAAAESSDDYDVMESREINDIASKIEVKCSEALHTVSVEEISDYIENELMNSKHFQIARNFITYRYKRALARKSNTTDDSVLSLLEQNNEEAKQENSNKNPVINSTQRDYMAGEVSKDLTMRVLLPDDIVKAHNEGLIHFHDSDYFAQHMHNCCLVNLEDMLQNGTVITDTLIETPKSFSVACNVATQIVAQVASNQYGGQTISLAHLAPFVDVSRQKLRKQIEEEVREAGAELSKEQIKKIAEKRLKREIEAGVQLIQYQLVTLMTTNGQTPFVSIFMYINEVPEGQIRDDLIMIIEEMLRQRIKGLKNEKGVYVTPAFPKLLLVTQDDMIHKGDRYYDIFKLAVECTSKRMVPDYISERL